MQSVACNRCGRVLSGFFGVSTKCAECGIPYCPDCNQCDTLCRACRATAPRALSTFLRSVAVRPKLWALIVLPLVIAGGYGAVAIQDAVERENERTEAAVRDAREAVIDRARERAESVRARLYDARDPSVMNVAITDRPCPIAVRQVGELRHRIAIAQPFVPSEEVDWTRALEMHLNMGPQAEVMPRSVEGVGPLRRRVGVYSRPDARYRLTLVVDTWTDPILPAERELPARFIVGRVTGRALLYDYREARVVCACDVSAMNGDVTLVSQSGLLPGTDDPLAMTRVDLPVQALRAAVPALRAVDHPN